jgi:hypothetical protein
MRVGLGVISKKLSIVKSGSDGAAEFLMTFALAPSQRYGSTSKPSPSQRLITSQSIS